MARTGPIPRDGVTAGAVLLPAALRVLLRATASGAAATLGVVREVQGDADVLCSAANALAEGLARWHRAAGTVVMSLASGGEGIPAQVSYVAALCADAISQVLQLHVAWGSGLDADAAATLLTTLECAGESAKALQGLEDAREAYVESWLSCDVMMAMKEGVEHILDRMEDEERDESDAPDGRVVPSGGCAESEAIALRVLERLGGVGESR